MRIRVRKIWPSALRIAIVLIVVGSIGLSGLNVTWEKGEWHPSITSIQKAYATTSNTTQILVGGVLDNPLTDGTTEYNLLQGSKAWSSNETSFYEVIPTDGTIRNLKIKASVAPGAGNSWTLAIRLGARGALANTTQNVTITGSETYAESTGADLDVSPGQIVTISIVGTSTPSATAIYWCCDFESDYDNESIYMGNATDVPTSTRFRPLVGSAIWGTSEATQAQGIMPTTGTWKKLYLDTNIGAGVDTSDDAFTITFSVNATNTALSAVLHEENLTSSNTTATVATVATDLVNLRVALTSAPTGASYIAWGLVFVADSNGESLLLSPIYNTLDPAATEYNTMMGQVFNWGGTEASAYMMLGAGELYHFYVMTSVVPGTDASHNLTIRQNTTNTNLFAVISGNATMSANNTSSTVTISDYDLVTIQNVPNGTPAAGSLRWGLVYKGTQALMLTTDNITGIGETSATVSGNITDADSGNYTTRGFQRSTTSNDYSSSSNVSEDGSFGTGVFSLEFTSLTLGETYYTRAFAIRSGVVYYASEIYFTTRSACIYGDSSNITLWKANKTEATHSAQWAAIQVWATAHISDTCPAGNTTGDAAEVRTFIENMLFMYHMTDNASYADLALEWAGYVAVNWPDWNDTTVGTSNWRQSAAALSMAMGAVYYDLHDYMSSENRSVLLGNITGTSIPTGNLVYMYDTYSPIYVSPWTTSGIEWPATVRMIASALGFMAIALNSDYDGSDEWLAFADSVIAHEMTAYGTDGGSTEGPSYGAVGWSYMANFLDAEEKLTATNPFTTYTWLSNSGYYPIYMTVYSASHNGTKIQIEDTTGTQSYNATYPISFMHLVASKFNNGYYQTWANAFSWPNDPMCYIWKSKDVVPLALDGLELYRAFDGIGYLICRTGWEEDALTILFKSGHSLGHAHPNSGMLVVVKNGVFLTGDPGYSTTYTEYQAASVQSGVSTGSYIGNDGKLYGYSQGREPADLGSTLQLGITGNLSSIDANNFYIQWSGNQTALFTDNTTASEDGQWPYTRTGDLTKWITNIVIIPDKEFIVRFDLLERADSNNETHWKITALDSYDVTGIVNPEWLYDAGSDTWVTDIVTARLETRIFEPASGNYTAQSANYTGPETREYTLLTITPSNNVAIQNYLTMFSADNHLSTGNFTITKIIQDNCLGLKITSDNRTDLVLFSTDGNAVNEVIDLGDYYQAADGETYSFSGTSIQAAFSNGYIVMGLEDAEITPPDVETNPATLIEEATATLNGELIDDGGGSTVGFEWDTDLALPLAENWQDVGIATNGTFSHPVAGLNKGDKYAFHATANNTASADNGTLLYFMTKPDPAVSLTSTSNGTTWIMLDWSNGLGMDLVGIRWAIVSAPTDNVSGTQGYWGAGNTANITGLPAGSAIFFRIDTYALEDGTWSVADGDTTFSDTTDSLPATPATTDLADIGTVLLRNLLTVLVAAGALLTVMRRPNDPVTWIIATVIAAVVITIVQTTL